MLKKSILILIMLAMYASPAFSQNSLFPTVEVSEITTEQNGKLYYVHNVMPKQTFYSICRAYDVSVDDIYKANPGGALNNGLKAGMVILIPAKSDPMEKAIGGLQIVSAAEDTVAHTTSGTQSLTEKKKYNIPEEAKYIEYRVKWFETLQTIAKKHNISVEAIIYLNNLENENIETGQKLVLPSPEFAKYFEKMEELVVEEETIEEIEEIEDNTPIIEPLQGEAKIALILPFEADEEIPNYNYYDFYSGFLLAVNSLKEKGMNINLTVLDEYNYGLNDKFDFIVGPVFSEQIAETIEFCNENQIPLISPLDPSAEQFVDSNPFLIQVPASIQAQVKNLISSINYNEINDNVVVIHETGILNDSYYNNITSELQSQNIPFKTFDYTILDGRDISEPLKKSFLDIEKQNHVIVASEKEFFASDAVRNISILTLDSIPCNITGYGSQRLRNFETIETEAYENVSMHFSSAYYIDYTNPEVKDFVYKFRALYNTEPTTYAFQGNDVATYFLNALNTYGKNFMYFLEENPMKMMQSNIHLYRKEDGGLTNKATINIIYRPDYIIEIK